MAWAFPPSGGGLPSPSLAILDEQVATLLQAWGMGDDHRIVTADHITYADKHGIDSHGSRCSVTTTVA